MKTYTDTGWCPNCKADTMQTFIDAEHERDSSGDSQTCLTCKWRYSGFTGKWEPPYEEQP